MSRTVGGCDAFRGRAVASFWRRSAPWAAIVVCAGLVAGCSTATPGPIGSPSADEEARWSLPMDSFVQTVVEQVMSDQAYKYLIRDCMAAKGVVYPVVPVSESQLTDGGRSAGGFVIFNEKTAATRGYSLPRVAPADVEARNLKINGMAFTAAQEEVLTACAQSAQGQYGLSAAQDLHNSFVAKVYESWKKATADGAVVAAAKVWHACMAPLGVSDLPDGPDDGAMPTASLMAAWGLKDGPTAARDPSAAEVKVAVADAKCRASSGYTHALYLATWRLQTRRLQADPSLADQGARARSTYDTLLTASRAVVAAHAGT